MTESTKNRDNRNNRTRQTPPKSSQKLSVRRAPIPRCLGGFAGEVLPIPKVVSGVYFLVHFDEVMYVGKSTNIAVRCTSHAKRFPHVRMFFIPVPVRLLDATEMEFIHRFKPPMNSQYKRQRSIDRLIAFERFASSLRRPRGAGKGATA